MQVGLVSEVAAVEHLLYHLASDFFFLDNTLVHPVPDEAAEHARIRVDFVPIFLEVAKGVTHAVGIFAGQHGARSTVGAHPDATVARALGDFQ